MSLTSPLGLMRHVRRPNLRMEVVPWLNVLCVGWMMTLLGSSYIYAPGLAVGVASPTDNYAPHLALPESSGQPALLHIDTALTIIPPYYYLDDGRHYLTDLPAALSNSVKRLNRPHLVLLLKINRDVPSQVTLDVAQMAHKAGFETVQLAEIPAPEPDLIVPATPASSGTKSP